MEDHMPAKHNAILSKFELGDIVEEQDEIE